MKRLIYIVSFCLITPLTLMLSLLLLQSYRPPSPKPAVLSAQAAGTLYPLTPPTSQVYAATIPNNSTTVTGQAIPQDARTEIIRQYLKKYESPLEPYAASIVAEADRFGLDFRLTTAIAQQESNLCKKIPPDSYNCWGWGIHSQGSLHFSSYQEAIETVTLGLKESYIGKGLVTPSDIMTKYTPLSNGSWAEGVSHFISEME